MRKVLIFVIDGCAPEYLTEKTAPDIFRLAKQDGGFVKTVQAAVPTVTNVNHACILSGAFPEDTHVIGNYYYNRQTGRRRKNGPAYCKRKSTGGIRRRRSSRAQRAESRSFPSGKTGTGSPSAGSKPGQQQVDFSRRLPMHKKRKSGSGLLYHQRLRYAPLWT